MTDWLALVNKLPAEQGGFGHILLTSEITCTHEANKTMCISRPQFVQILNGQYHLSGFIKKKKPKLLFKWITITVNCEATLYLALFYNLLEVGNI